MTDALARAGAEITRLRAPEVADGLSLAGRSSRLRLMRIWAETIEAAPQKMFPRILDRFCTGAQIRAMDHIAGPPQPRGPAGGLLRKDRGL